MSVAGSRVAALIGFVTTAVKGTVAVMADETSFNRIVIAMSGEILRPNWVILFP